MPEHLTDDILVPATARAMLPFAWRVTERRELALVGSPLGGGRVVRRAAGGGVGAEGAQARGKFA